MPRVFVPGPNVRLNAASPASFIENIQKTLASFGKERIAKEKVDAARLFQDQTLEREDRRLDFAEGADKRARAEEQFKFEQGRERASVIAKSQLAAVQGTGNSGIQSFIDNPEAQKVFKDLGFTDTDKILGRVKDLAGDDKTLFSNPKIWGQAAYEKIIAGGGSITEADAARAKVQTKFSTLPTNFAEKLLSNSTGASSLTNKIFSGKGVGTTGKSIQGAPGQIDEEKLRDILTGRINIDEARESPMIDAVLNLFGAGDPTRSFWDIFQRDLDQGDIDRVIGTYGDRFPQHAIVGAMRSIVNPDDGTVDQDKWLAIVNDPNSDESKTFVTEIKNWQAKAERTRGGKILNNLGADEIFSLISDIQKAQDARNFDIISRTIPRQKTFEERLAAFSAKFGANTPQPGGQNVVPPGIVPPGVGGLTDPAGQGNAGGAVNDVSTGSTGLDKLLAGVAADPGPGAVEGIINSPQGRDQQNLLPGNLVDPVAARSGIENSVVGSNGPTFQQLETQQKIGEITKTLNELPPSIAQTLAQKNAKPKLEKELQALQTGVILPPPPSATPKIFDSVETKSNDEFEIAKSREVQERSTDEESSRINARIQRMGKTERKNLIAQGKAALKSGEITISDLAGIRGTHDDKLIELIIRRKQ